MESRTLLSPWVMLSPTICFDKPILVISERNPTVISFTNMGKDTGNCVPRTERSTVVTIWHHGVRICAI